MEGQHGSLWTASRQGAPHPPLGRDIRCEVAVVGGGMVGLLTAYLLQQQGKEVVVLEAGRLSGGVTGHTTAKLTAQHGAVYHTLTKRFGGEGARTHAQANEEGRQWIVETARRLGADARIQAAPAYIYAETASDAEVLRKEAEAASHAGLPMEFVEETELPFPVLGALRLDGQAHFHPVRFLEAVAKDLVASGGRIFEQTRVVDYKDAVPCTITTEQAHVVADHVVIATNVPINDKAYFVTRLKPSRAYGIAVRSDYPLQGMYINQGTPVRSVRPYLADDGPMLVLVGERHPVGEHSDTEKHHERLIAFARDQFDAGEVLHRWSTQDYYPVDDLPFIGPISPRAKHIWTATGFRGWGMTQSVVAAMVLSEAAQGRRHAWADLYDPFSAARVAKELPGAAKMQVQVGTQFVKGHLKDDDDELAPGEGFVKKIEGRSVAVHRDASGKLHSRLATCPHMGCIVAWNQSEQSWDCPCHGSRFQGDDVLHGPASTPLARPKD